MLRTTRLTVVAFWLFAASSSAGLVVHYDFNGNTLDSSGLGNNGTIFGNPAFVAGQIDQAIYFNNPIGQQVATQYVSLPNSASILALQNSSFTFAINYLSNDTTINNGRLFGRQPSSGSFIGFGVNSGALETSTGVRDTTCHALDTLPVVSGNPIARTSDGQWHWGIVVLDRAAGELRQYVDTNLVATVPFGAFDSVTLSDLNIGRIAFNTTFGARLTAVDDFRLYSQALTTAEVNQLVNAFPEPSSLVSAAMGLAGLAGYAGGRRVRPHQPS